MVLRDSGQRPPSQRRPGARCWAIDPDALCNLAGDADDVAAYHKRLAIVGNRSFGQRISRRISSHSAVTPRCPCDERRSSARNEEDMPADGGIGLVEDGAGVEQALGGAAARPSIAVYTQPRRPSARCWYAIPTCRRIALRRVPEVDREGAFLGLEVALVALVGDGSWVRSCAACVRARRGFGHAWPHPCGPGPPAHHIATSCGVAPLARCVTVTSLLEAPSGQDADADLDRLERDGGSAPRREPPWCGAPARRECRTNRAPRPPQSSSSRSFRRRRPAHPTHPEALCPSSDLVERGDVGGVASRCTPGYVPVNHHPRQSPSPASVCNRCGGPCLAVLACPHRCR